MYVRPTIDGEVTTFGVSGKLWRDSLLMYDRATESLWSQLLGEAVTGPLEGRELEEIPSEVTTWGAWKQRHPGTLVLEKDPRGAIQDGRRQASAYESYHEDPEEIGVVGSENRDPRLPGKQLVFGMTREADAAAVPFSLLEQKPVLNSEAFGVPVAVFSPPGENAAMAYVRQVDGETLVFERVEDAESRLTVRDQETGSTWSWETGACLQGAFEGRSLERIQGIPAYWGIWNQFHPETYLIRSGF